MKYHSFTLLLALAALPLSAQSDTIYGDLDADGLPEMLVNVDHPEPLYDSTEGVTILETATVYRKGSSGTWQAWPAATGFLMHAYDEAGLDRFYPRIERGALVLVHGKGGWLNWDTTHRFRWQNGRFQLIGYTHQFFDRCHERSTFDYNLSTGRWTFSRAYFSCDDYGEPELDGGVNEERAGVMKPAEAYTLQDGAYLDFGPPEE